MRKRIISGLLMITGFFLFAGDVARFVDIGFSADGKTYFFGQYGKIDNKFLPYAEIYAVDVKKNDFIKTFKTEGTSQMQNGSSIYEELLAKNTTFYQHIQLYARKGTADIICAGRRNKTGHKHTGISRF